MSSLIDHVGAPDVGRESRQLVRPEKLCFGEVATPCADFPRRPLGPRSRSDDDHAFASKGLDHVGDDVTVTAEHGGDLLGCKGAGEVDRHRGALAFHQGGVDLDIDAELRTERFDGFDAANRTAAVDPFDPSLREQICNVGSLIDAQRVETAVEVVVRPEAATGSR